jgi:transposase
VKKATRFVVRDVHADTIAVAVAEAGRDGEVRSLGIIPNRPNAVRKLVQRLGGTKGVKACYEAGPTGYALYWELQKLGLDAEVIAPTVVPVKAGERVKTDRRDAVKLARCYRAGELTAVWVPAPAHEALRDPGACSRGRQKKISCELVTGSASSCCATDVAHHQSSRRGAKNTWCGR